VHRRLLSEICAPLLERRGRIRSASQDASYYAAVASAALVAVSTSRGEEPQWRRDGSELFYVAPDGWLMAFAVYRRASSIDFAGAVSDVARPCAA
jgi:hypothetical protein